MRRQQTDFLQGILRQEFAQRMRAGGDDAIPDSSLVTESPAQFRESVLSNSSFQLTDSTVLLSHD